MPTRRSQFACCGPTTHPRSRGARTAATATPTPPTSPERWDTDVLRMQYLNNVELDPEAIVLNRDSAEQLLAAILKEQRSS